MLMFAQNPSKCFNGNWRFADNKQDKGQNKPKRWKE